MAKQITDATWEQALQTDRLVVIDCGATWCGPCQHIAPIIEELASSYEGKADICTCDVDECEQIPSKYGIRNVPTVLFIKGGELLDKLVGAQPKSAYVKKIEEYM